MAISHSLKHLKHCHVPCSQCTGWFLFRPPLWSDMCREKWAIWPQFWKLPNQAAFMGSWPLFGSIIFYSYFDLFSSYNTNIKTILPDLWGWGCWASSPRGCPTTAWTPSPRPSCPASSSWRRPRWRQPWLCRAPSDWGEVSTFPPPLSPTCLLFTSSDNQHTQYPSSWQSAGLDQQKDNQDKDKDKDNQHTQFPTSWQLSWLGWTKRKCLATLVFTHGWHQGTREAKKHARTEKRWEGCRDQENTFLDENIKTRGPSCSLTEVFCRLKKLFQIS